MKKVILIDGNNLVFRSYYATAYTGNMMKNSKGFPTNALYGFVSMINKIIVEEKPEYMAIAFDIGKNFRKEKYDFYKEGRSDTPEELKQQFPVAKEIVKAMGIKCFELEPYEADDIIGTFVKMAENDDDYDATIISSDKDLLQLISHETEVKLLRQKDHIRYDYAKFKEDYGIEPINIIDMKALAGDQSDNIPGVKGIGDKTALSLLQSYGDLDGIYENIDLVKGKLKEKLEIDKDKAYISKEIATIYCDVPLNIEFKELKYEGEQTDLLMGIYEDLEFYSFLKKFDKKTDSKSPFTFKIVNEIDDIEITDEYAFYIECDATNYHVANIIGMALATKEKNYYVKKELIPVVLEKIKDSTKYTYDLKKNIVLLKNIGFELGEVNTDLMIAAYLLNLSLKDDIAYLMVPNGVEVSFYEGMLKSKFEDIEVLTKDIVRKARFIFDNRDDYIKRLKTNNMFDLYKNIEHPLIEALADMESIGVDIDKHILDKQKEEVLVKLDILSKDIYNLAGEEFNISSPKQLGDILFEKLGLPHGKKNNTGYSTDVKVLNKLQGTHQIIDKILEYRNLNKLYTTYLEGLTSYIRKDGKIHTIFKQNLTRTGRLSSVEPNLQNIPIRTEEGRKVRKAFIPSEDSVFMCADYSQIELRILAHISRSDDLISAFIEGQDIHSKVAADIFDVELDAVTKSMRRTSKAVIFGIVYGISGFGLGDNLEISFVEARKFIDKYLEIYPGVKTYMDEIVKEAYDEGCVRTLFNRKRIIDELQNKNYMMRQSGERIALNTPIQGTAADIMKKAMVDVYQEFKKQGLKSKIIIQVHDELVIDCRIDEQEKVLSIVTDKMENVIKLDVPIKIEVDTGINWYEAK